VKRAANTAIDVLETGICTTVMDVFATGISPGNVATSVSLYRQNQRANGATSVSLYGQNQRGNYHCAYKTELAEHFQFSILRCN
jgi:hypothetical protein